MVIAVTVVTVGAALAVPVLLDNWRAAADQVKPITHVPANDHALGLVYTGLVPAKKGDPCVGAYQVADRNTCTHGPDAPPNWPLSTERARCWWPGARTSSPT